MSGEARRRRLRALLARAGKRPTELSRIDAAFVHESYAREQQVASNERMEFLGDAVLGYLVARWLYEQFPNESEGALTLRRSRIVNDVQLAQTARRIEFPDLLLLGTGMRNADGAQNTTILADAFEAFVAALYLEYGVEVTRKFIEREHLAQLDHDASRLLDAKSRLQLLAQEQLNATPSYHEESCGTPQQPLFSSIVSVNGEALGTGQGASKKAAQQAAATQALLALEHRIHA